jgi:NFACT protein C-terminal domain
MLKAMDTFEKAQLSIEDDLVEVEVNEAVESGLSIKKFGGSAEFDADVEENTPSLFDEESKEIVEDVVEVADTHKRITKTNSPAVAVENFQDSSSAKAAKQSVPRGKKAKLKKITAKYADQDDDDRQLALELLGSAKGPQPKGKKAKALADKQKIREEKDALLALESEKLKQPKVPKQSRNTVLKDDVEIDLESLVVNLDCLTGFPAEDDEILACLPVCAPWTVLQKYKYRIKLLPGSLKKGKGAKSAQASFISMATKIKSPFELEAIRNVLDQTWIDTMLAKTKLENR